MKKAVLIMNEDHCLFREQEDILKKNYYEIDHLFVPKQGWTLEEMKSVFSFLKRKLSENFDLVFVSPIPFLLVQLAREDQKYSGKVRVFHNDKREKLQLKDGRIIYKVSEMGWQLL